MQSSNSIIAIDGFSSCGKSTLAKQLAIRLGYAYIDSGAMYRAVTLHLLNNNVDVQDISVVEELIKSAKIEFQNVGDTNLVFLNNEDVSEEIRKMYVSKKVSKVSPILCVRKALVKQQQHIGATQNIIMDGRDIGTQVFPYAAVKLFMTADPTIRAKRRHAELVLKSSQITFNEVYQNLMQRDHDDTTRSESPLVCANDAVVIDNTNLSMEEQFMKALEIIQSNLLNTKFLS